jgi:hypothetical protein
MGQSVRVIDVYGQLRCTFASKLIPQLGQEVASATVKRKARHVAALSDSGSTSLQKDAAAVAMSSWLISVGTNCAP